MWETMLPVTNNIEVFDNLQYICGASFGKQAFESLAFPGSCLDRSNASE